MNNSPSTAGPESFYYGYCVHNYHMAIYGCMLGAMERKGMEISEEFNAFLNESFFHQYPDVASYLESYAALEIHIMVRFGRWEEILQVPLPKDQQLMLFRTASILYARALAWAMLGNIENATKEADRFDLLRKSHPDVNFRILHNNTVASLLELDAVMMRGEIAYKAGKTKEGLTLLRKAVEMQDALNYDEPWGKMQPIRHALGGLLLEQDNLEEAESVFRKDLKIHPKNPWSLVGLLSCLNRKEGTGTSSNTDSISRCCHSNNVSGNQEMIELEEQLRAQRQVKWADYNVIVACECCQHLQQ